MRLCSACSRGARILGRLFAAAQDTRATPTYRRIKQKLDAIPAIDTHDHLFPFDRLPCIEETKSGRGVNLAGLWHNSYYRRFNPLTAWKPGMDFDEWWQTAKHDFKDARATSFYRYQLPAFQDLYGVDFDQITDGQARRLDRQIFENYKDRKWLYHVVTERANIELMLNDPYWARYAFTTSYPWEVLVFNVTPLTRGFHASEFTQAVDNPYEFAKKHGLPVDTLDDYLKVLERLFLEAKDRGAVCLKTTLAYQRTLSFDNVPRRGPQGFRTAAQATSHRQEIKDFEDFIMWRLCESAPIRAAVPDPHGHGRFRGPTPILLVDLIEANPKTKFILFHGGYPWVGETGAIVHAARPACLGRLGLAADDQPDHGQAGLPRMAGGHALQPDHVGGRLQPCRGDLRGHRIHAACLAEVLAEKVDRGDLSRSTRRGSAARSFARMPWTLPQLRVAALEERG